MQELRLVTAIDEGARLLLRAPDGSEYALALDEKLKAAARGDRVRLGQLEIESDAPLRPRDIQARIRAGASAAEVADAAGIPLERVRRYEGPVLAEREHMAAMARRTPLRGSVPSDGPALLLGDVVAQRLRTRGVDPDRASWDSWRRDDGQWQVAVYPQPTAATARRAGAPDMGSEVRDEDEAGPAERILFLFDPARRAVGPDDEEAGLLIAEQPTRTGGEVVAGLIREASGTGDRGSDRRITAGPATSGRGDRVAESRRPRRGRSARLSAATPTNAQNPPDDDGRVRADIFDLPAPAAESGPTAAGAGPYGPGADGRGADGTSALGPGGRPPRDRGAAARLRGDDGMVVPRVGVPAMGGLVPLAPVPPRRPLQRDDTDGGRPAARRSRRPHVPASATAPISRRSAYDERLINPAERPPTAARPRRQSVPSWDEILFGTRTRSTD